MGSYEEDAMLESGFSIAASTYGGANGLGYLDDCSTIKGQTRVVNNKNTCDQKPIAVVESSSTREYKNRNVEIYIGNSSETRMKNTAGQWYILAKIDI